MISENPAFFFTLLDLEHFETIGRYKPTEEYISVVSRLVGEGYKCQRGGFWTQFTPEECIYRQQGWKIHISAVPTSAQDMLQRITPVLSTARVGFKFCSDPGMLDLSLNKNWPRTGAGKFITIYPSSDEQFLSLIECCDQATRGLVGPYILSDRLYRDSKVVFYRYGEHAGSLRIAPTGERSPILTAPDGRIVSDVRTPFFQVPDWVRDPFVDEQPVSKPDPGAVLLNNRYRVRSAERFSSVGGIYVADDTVREAQVIIREGRPMFGGTSSGYDSLKLLQKEARILTKLRKTGYLAQFVELFQEWEHWFLVQERLQAESLWGYAMNFTIGTDDQRNPTDLFGSIRETIAKVARGLQVVHDHDVVLRDLTKSNVMFTRDTNEVRFIDLELAFELDRDEPPIAGWTTGYASQQQLQNRRPTVADDCFALGALIVDMIAFTAPGLPLNREGILASFDFTLAEQGLPPRLRQVVDGLMDQDESRRWTLSRVLEELYKPDSSRIPPARQPQEGALPVFTPTSELVEDLRNTIHGITRHICATGDLDRDDRLWPASGEVFSTNPIGVQYGAAGILHYLNLATGSVPEREASWLFRHINPRRCPSGLCVGLSGVAAVLLGLGFESKAVEVMDASRDDDGIYSTPGLYYGASGWGLANLHFWYRLSASSYLASALEVGEFLLQTAKTDSEGLYWLSDGLTPFGLGHGGSGIALFLLHLAMASNDERFTSAAVAALDFEIANRQELGARYLWFSHKDARASGPKSPHMRFGTAGIGSAILRCAVVTGEPRFWRVANVCATTVANRFTNKIWQDYGLCGYGEFLLDMYRFTGEDQFLNSAYYLAEALLPHRMQRGEGIAFAGSELLRVSCDYGMGSAGIGAYLCRLLNPRIPRFLVIDELFTPVASRVSLARSDGSRSATNEALVATENQVTSTKAHLNVTV